MRSELNSPSKKQGVVHWPVTSCPGTMAAWVVCESPAIRLPKLLST